MNPMLDTKITTVRPDKTWPSLLDCAVKEVFQIMVHTDLTPMPGARKQARRGILPPWLVWPELCAVFKLLI
jgi:hypothetical protein